MRLFKSEIRSRRHRVRARRLAVVALAAALVLTTAACGGSGSKSSSDSAALAGSWADVEKAAAKEGKVTLYGNLDPEALDAVGKAFMKKYPDIQFDKLRGSSGELGIRLDQEESSGSAGGDVLITTDILYEQDKAAKGSIAAPMGPESESGDWAKNIEDGIVTISLDPYLLAWNTDLHPAPIASLGEVLKDKDLTGSLGIVDAVSTSMVAIYNKYTALQGDDFLDQVATLKPRLYPSLVPVAQALAAGEVDVVFPTLQSAVKATIDAGAPVKFIHPPDAPIGAAFYAHSVKASKNPNASQLLIDFMMSKEGQVIVNGDLGQSPVAPAAERTIQTISFDGLDDAAVKKFNANFKVLFK